MYGLEEIILLRWHIFSSAEEYIFIQSSRAAVRLLVAVSDDDYM